MAHRVYVTRVIPQPGIELLRGKVEVDVNESDIPLSGDELCDKAGNYDALVTLLTDSIDADVLQSGQGKLRICANVAVGYDNIDVKSATEAGVMVTNTPGVLTDTTADFAWALLMTVARRVVEGDSFVRAGKFHGWGILMLLGGDVHGKTLGLVGFGRIGQAVARRAGGFGMRILYFDPIIEATEEARLLGATKVELETLLRESDFVSLHTPLSAETHHLMSEPQFHMMKSTAYLINTARGPIVDEAELARALQEGQIAGAGLDVFEEEPAVHPELMSAPNAVITPHIASGSVDTRTKMATMAAENVLAALSGQRPPTIVNPDVLR